MGSIRQQDRTLDQGVFSPLCISDVFTIVGNHTTNAALSSAVTLTPPAGAWRIMIQVFSQNIRFTLDGTTPTSSTGFLLTTGNPPALINVESGMTLKVIETAASASIQYQWGH